MQKIVGIRFNSGGKIYFFDPENIRLWVGDHVIVETARGMEYGKVATRVSYVEEETLKHPVKPIIRKATEQDALINRMNLDKAPEALRICKEQVEKNKLTMKLIRAEYTFDSSKVIFYFTADGRVDFRELVKDLASIFRIRIELRQIGVRDEAKIVGGIGCCGRELCCHKWMGEFDPVSIKMAKEQGLSLNPGKISGVCGRLLCCLKFEHETYEDALANMPELGDRVKTPDGTGYIQKLNILAGRVTVQLDGDEAPIKEYGKQEVKTIDRRRKKAPVQKEAVNPDELTEEEKRALRELQSEKFNKDDM
ncbi:MAG: stage 0 sporulation family protein [Eubacteriaceae bacterium]|nr:stage 0 sporulation family protein [Eubacteriaceae bacterium]